MKLFLKAICASLAIAAFGPYASAQNVYWSGGTSGEFNNGSNWNTQAPNTTTGGATGNSGVPGATSIAVIDVDLNNGTVIDDFTGGITNTPLNITLSSVTPSGNVVQGLAVSDYFFWGTSTGSVTLTNTSGTALTVTGTNAASGDLVVDGYETLGYTGALSLNKGTAVIGDNDFYNIGTEPGPGTLVLNGATVNFTPLAGQTTTTYVGASQVGNPNGFLFGSATGVVTENTSTMILGNTLYLGYNGGSGTWNLTNGSLLTTGTSGVSAYNVYLGSNGGSNSLDGTGGNGVLNIQDTSVFLFGTAGSAIPTNLILGLVDPLYTGTATIGAGQGTINQSGSSTVNFAGTETTVAFGETGGGTHVGASGSGTYNLSGGTLNIGTNATDAVVFVLGDGLDSVGALNQTGGVMNVGNVAGTNGTLFVVGGDGFGTYTISGGTANFNQALTISNTGQVNLNGGQINITLDNLGGTGTFDFGGGTLKLLPGTITNEVWDHASTLTAGTSTIDASTANLTSFTFANALSGAGGLILTGNGNTVFNFASQATPGAFGSQAGVIGITGGTLNAAAEDIANSSMVMVGTAGTPATLNLAVGSGANASATLKSAIIGTGTLNINFDQANGTVTFKGASPASGVTIVLAADTGPLASTTPGTLQVYSGAFGTITETNAGNNLMVGDNTGTTTGAVTIQNVGYTGLTTVNAGFSLTAPNLLGAATVSGMLTTTDPTLGIVGNVTNNGGIVMVNGTDGIGGNVVANTGTIVTPSVTGTVNNAGTLVSLSTGDLTNSGIIFLSTTSAVGSNFAINGGLSSTGTLVVRLSGGVFDTYTATGAGTLSGVIAVNGSGTTAATPIITEDGGITIGGDGSLNSSTGLISSPTENGVLFSAVLSHVGNSIDIATTQRTILEAEGLGLIPSLTPNQTQVAITIDPVLVAGNLPFGQALNNAADANAGAIPGVLDSLSPESLQYARTISFENSNFLAIRMHNVDSDLRAGYGGLDMNAVSVTSPAFNNNLGHSMNSFMASDVSPYYHQAAPNGVNYYPGGQPGSPAGAPAEEAPTFEPSSQVISDTPNPYLAVQNPAGPETPKTSEFIGGDVVLADLNQDHSAANSPSGKANYTAGDAVAGVSYRVTPHLAAGVLFDYNHTEADTDSNGSKIKVDSYSPGLFATFFDHGFYVDGLAAFGYNSYENTRVIPLLGTTASSSPSGEQYLADLNAGYDFHPDKAWVVGPAGSLTYTHLDVDSFTESGAPGADLSVDSQSVDSLRSRLGAQAVYQTNTGDVLLQPNLSVMWQHEFLDNSSGITSSFADFNANSFTINTLAPSRDSALISVGLTATLSTSMALYLNYMADVGASDYWAQSVVGGFKARF